MVVDAGIFVSYLLPRDDHHTRCRDWMRQQLSEGAYFVAPIILLTEVGGAIARRASSNLGRRAVSQLQQLPGLRLLPVDHSLGVLATELAIELRLRGADAIYVATAERLNIPLAALDREQQERAKSRVSVVVL